MKRFIYSLIALSILMLACNISAPTGQTPVPTTASVTGSPVGSVVPSQTLTTSQPQIPSATGPCPEFQNGWVTFSPAGVSPRQVFLWIGDTGGGPLVFWWHGAGGSAQNASLKIGPDVISQITAQGGVAASIEADPSLSFGEWYLNTTDRQDDLIVADMVVACAFQEKQIDVTRIHVAGSSAGGKQAAQMAVRRSSYVASVVLYSGGLFPESIVPHPPYEDPGNQFPSLVFWGGASDVVLVNNVQSAQDYYDFVSLNGNFTVMCDHNGGHTIPPEGPAAAWRFFQDHPWGVSPEPYLNEMPSEIPDYCTANP